MIATRMAILLGVIVVAVLVGLAADGFTPVVAPLVTIAVLVLLIAGGSQLHDRGGRDPR